jgi:hypothetical protein
MQTCEDSRNAASGLLSSVNAGAEETCVGDGNHNSVIGTVGLEEHVNPLAPSRYSQASPGIQRRLIGRIWSVNF